MADRFPLILNTNANQIQEIASGDTLDLSGTNIKGVGIITATNISGNIIAGAGTSNIVAGIITAVTFKGDGDFVELDVDGHTNLDNVNIAGIVTANQIKLEDNKFLLLGTGNDLQLRHDGSHSYIQDTGTGNLYFTSNNFNFFSPTNEKYAVFNNNSSVEFYWDNSKKFETSSTGITVTGIVVATGADINGDIDIDGHTNLDNINITGVTTTTGVVVINAGTQSTNSTSGALRVAGGAGIQKNVNVGGDLDVDGHTSLDNVSVAGILTASNSIRTGTNFELESDVGKLKIGASQDLELYHNGTHSFIDNSQGQLYIRGGSQVVSIQATNVTHSIRCAPNAEVKLYHAGSQKFQTTSTGINVTGDGVFSGNVSIGGTLTYEDVTNIDSVGIVTARDDIKIITDNKKLQIGAGQDLKLYHDGNHSYVSNNGGAGNLILYGNGTNSIVLQPVPGENGIIANSNGSVELFYNNTKVLETKGYGLDIAGGFIQTGSSIVNDNGQFKLGTGGDYKLYHDGSSSFMDNVTGDLYMRNSSGQILIRANTDCYISNYAANEHRAAFKNNGAVELYYDGSKRFETTSTGIDVTGVIETTVAGADNMLKIKTTSSGDPILQFNAAGSGGHDIYYNRSTNELTFKSAGGSDRLKIAANGDLLPAIDSQYNIGSSSARFANIYADAINVAGGTNAVTISHTSGAALTLTRSSKNISFNANYGASNSHAAIEATSGMDIRFYLGGGEKIVFESAGNIVPTTDSQITLGNSSKRFTAVWSDYVEANNFGSLGQYSGKFGRIRVGADVYGNTIKTESDNNLNITVPHSVYFNTGANANGSDAGTARLRIYSGGIVPTSDKSVDLGSTSIAWRNVYTDNIVTTTALSNRNVIHNGTMFVAQRGTSQSGVNSSGYAKAADRWKLEANGSNVGTYTVSRSTDNPGEFGYSYKIQCTTAHSSLANNEMYEFVQYIEGRNVQRFNKGNSAAKPFALSFSVKTNKTGTYAVLLLDHQNSRMCCANYTVSNTGWNRYEIVFPADTTGEWTYSTTYRLSVKFCLLTGGLFQGGTLQTTWGAATNSNSRVGHNVNLADTVGNTFYITGVQLEAASACTPYEHKDYTEVVRECQRYLYTTPILGAGVWNGTSSFFTACHVPVPMRVHPTVSTNSGNFNTINIEHTDTYGVNSFTQPSSGHGNPNSTAAQSYSGYSSFIIGLGVTYSIDEVGRGGLVVCDSSSDFFILDAQL